MARSRKHAKKSTPKRDVSTDGLLTTVPLLDTLVDTPPVASVAAMLAEVEQALDVCPFCERWNSRTRGHRRGCKLGEFLGRVAA